MANVEHLSLLGGGVEAWERYRIRHPDIRLDLRGADLRGYQLASAHLIGARLNDTNLKGATLYQARLDSADLTGAYLEGVDLRGACLTRAKLIDANLEKANLSKTVLSNARLNGASLINANFTGAYFEGTDVSDAKLAETIIVDTTLRDTIGLDSCLHLGPSFVDFQTLSRSGALPDRFLRGIGLPDLLIEYIPSIVNRPIQYHSTFISYSNVDVEFAKHLYADLQDSGVRAWFAPEDMKIGDRFRTRIDEAIHVHEKLLLVLSEASLESNWVEKEVETAFEKERMTGQTILFPVRLDDEVIKRIKGWAADIKRTRHIGDFTEWRDTNKYKSNFQRLLRDLKR